MEKIQLQGNKGFVLVDDEDFEYLNQWKWYLTSGYAHRKDADNRTVIMHREILKTPKGLQTDHINHNRLDNRKVNLRICSASQNAMNRRLAKNNTTGYKGVSWYKRDKKWHAYIKLSKLKFIGSFNSKEEARQAYKAKAAELFGNFANP